jgi:hypothetical protein
MKQATAGGTVCQEHLNQLKRKTRTATTQSAARNNEGVATSLFDLNLKLDIMYSTTVTPSTAPLTEHDGAVLRQIQSHAQQGATLDAVYFEHTMARFNSPFHLRIVRVLHPAWGPLATNVDRQLRDHILAFWCNATATTTTTTSSSSSSSTSSSTTTAAVSINDEDFFSPS